MTTTRRRVLRPVPPAVAPAQAARHERWKKQLQADQQALGRWMSKLKGAVTTLDRLQARMGRLKGQLSGDSSASHAARAAFHFKLRHHGCRAANGESICLNHFSHMQRSIRPVLCC
jgi:hypothetical protein